MSERRRDLKRIARRDVRVIAARLGVVACVGVACLVGAGRLDDVVAIFDFRADAHAGATFAARTYPESEWVAGSAQVLDDARLWIPENARYRVVEGRRQSIAESSGYGRHFLRTLLLPREETSSDTAPWVLCYACTADTLGPGYEVLSESANGFLLLRRLP